MIGDDSWGPEFEAVRYVGDLLYVALNNPDGSEPSGGGFAPDWLGDALDSGKLFAETGGMEFVLAWVGLSVLVGVAARWMDHSAGAWFIISLITSPLAGGMFLLTRGKGRRTCPYCHDLNDVDEIYCGTCGWELPPPNNPPRS